MYEPKLFKSNILSAAGVQKFKMQLILHRNSSHFFLFVGCPRYLVSGLTRNSFSHLICNHFSRKVYRVSHIEVYKVNQL